MRQLNNPVVKVYIGVGSNLGDSMAHVLCAYNELESEPDISKLRRSSLYISKAVGPGEQEDYINGVFCFDTDLSALALLDLLQSIEAKHHRQRLVRWGPRTLDLDILLYGQNIIDSERLQVPHRYLSERSFVIVPLLELEPKLMLPTGTALADITIDKSDINIVPDSNLPTALPKQVKYPHD